VSRQIATERVWRTIDGRHVADGDPEAAFLVAAEGDEIPDEVIAAPAVDTDTEADADGVDHQAKAEDVPARKRGRRQADEVEGD
jgi:hypothetical protein